jgi:hypothetical protein
MANILAKSRPNPAFGATLLSAWRARCCFLVHILVSARVSLTSWRHPSLLAFSGTQRRKDSEFGQLQLHILVPGGRLGCHDLVFMNMRVFIYMYIYIYIYIYIVISSLSRTRKCLAGRLAGLAFAWPTVWVLVCWMAYQPAMLFKNSGRLPESWQ